LRRLRCVQKYKTPHWRPLCLSLYHTVPVHNTPHGGLSVSLSIIPYRYTRHHMEALLSLSLSYRTGTQGTTWRPLCLSLYHTVPVHKTLHGALSVSLSISLSLYPLSARRPRVEPARPTRLLTSAPPNRHVSNSNCTVVSRNIRTRVSSPARVFYTCVARHGRALGTS